MQNIFGASPMNPEPAVIPGGGIPGRTTGTFTGEPIINEQAMMGELYKPETRATDQLYSLLGNIPTRNKPGMLRKIAASLAAFSPNAPEMQEKILYEPYHRQMQDFEARFKPTLDVAQQERLQNVNLRQLADSIINRRIQDKRADDYSRSIDVREKQAETSRMRADSYIALNNYKMNPANADMEIIAPRGGNYTLVDPKGIKPPQDTGIPVGTLDQMQEINLRIQGAKEVAAVPRVTYGTTSTSSTTVTPPGSNPQEEKVGQFNRAMEAMNNPQWKDIVTIDDPNTNRFTLKVPKDGASAEEWTKYKDAYRYIFQRQPLFDQTPNTPSSEAGKPTVAAPTEKVRTTTSQSTRQSTSIRGNAPTSKPATTPPPVEQRKKGMRFKFPNGNVGEWDGTKWVPVTVVAK